MILLLVPICSVKASDNWLGDWQYRKMHKIQGSTSGEVTDYQMRIVVHYGEGMDEGENVYLNGKCRSDFGDIRFTDSESNLLDYWIEEYVDSDCAVFWVEIPNIPQNPENATIYIYYGKDVTTTSNGENTFILFDDFNDGTINAIWSQSGSMSESDGYLKIDGENAYVEASFDGLQNLKVITKVRQYIRDSQEGWEISLLTSGYDIDDYFDLYDYKDWLRMSRRGVGVQDYTSVSINTNWHKIKIVIYGDAFKEWYDGSLALDDTKPSSETYTYIRLKNNVRDTGKVWFDYVALAKYIDPEPTHGIWGEEEKLQVEEEEGISLPNALLIAIVISMMVVLIIGGRD